MDTAYAVLQSFSFGIFEIIIIIFTTIIIIIIIMLLFFFVSTCDLLHDVETMFHLRLLHIASGNLFRNISVTQ